MALMEVSKDDSSFEALEVDCSAVLEHDSATQAEMDALELELQVYSAAACPERYLVSALWASTAAGCAILFCRPL